jgi:DNA-3-methyladenine glycosylase
MKKLTNSFFNRDTQIVARALLGKVIRAKYDNIWLSAIIIETEAYYLREKASHAFCGYTEKRKALFMPAGTIYMYYARGGDSLNVSCGGKGNAVLIKSAFPYITEDTMPGMLKVMQHLNPSRNGQKRPIERLCAGQTLLCKALNLKVPIWDQQQFDRERFYIEDVGYRPKGIIQTVRLGIPKWRDEHLLYRFIDGDYVKNCTKTPCCKSKKPFVSTKLF